MNHYDPDKHHRRSVRLRGYDYARPGAYFVTICTWQRECLWGEAVAEKMVLNEWGQVVQRCWHDVPEHFPNVALDEFVVMPNHVHGIIVITGTVDDPVGAGSPRPDEPGIARLPGAETAPLRRPLLGQVVAYFKYQSTRKINEIRATPGLPRWQRNYYEHVIRNKDEWNNIRTYIAENPLKWELDENHPRRIGPRGKQEELKKLERETEAYYQSLSPHEWEEDRRWAKTSSRRAARLWNEEHR